MAEKKEKVSAMVEPTLVKRIDSLIEQNKFSSRSEFLTKAAEFYCGYLDTQNCSDYIEQTTLKFMEERLEKIEERMCKQLFRLCVESAMNSHLISAKIVGATDDELETLRRLCVSAVRKNTGNIRFDNIYAYQKGQITREEYCAD
jgi:metal-responsive CopG/Arc/MetJ family transcriptional regulator